MHGVFLNTILWTQIMAFPPAGSHVALLWTDDEVAQGFAWDPDQVSFGLPDHDGDAEVEVDMASTAPFSVAPDTLWPVAVPFRTSSFNVKVGAILDGRVFAIASGALSTCVPGSPRRAAPRLSP
jgi:hypothetical protein